MAKETDALQSMLRAALHAYEQARAVRLEAGRQIAGELNQTNQTLNAAQSAEQARLEELFQRKLAVAGGEQTRLGRLAAALAHLEQSARDLLTQAGLAHIAGAPLAVDGSPAPARRGDAEVTALFANAQTSYVELREALYLLAAAQLSSEQWEAARRAIRPLLKDREAPFYDLALELQRRAIHGRLNLVFVRVPAGEVFDDVSKQTVRLLGFGISYTPITGDQFTQFVEETGYKAMARGSGSAPVNNVSWDDAQAFCAWAGVALPTEQQWLRAALSLDEQGKRRIDVGRIPWEWCANDHESGGKVLRKFVSDGAVGSASRLRSDPDFRFDDLGFRVASPGF